MKDSRSIRKQLCSAGLSENEASVYLALLELGKGSVAQISRRAGLNRTTGYDILDRLVARRLASISGKEPKQEYLAESPGRLEYILLEELELKQRELEGVRAFIPVLKSLHNVAGRPRIRFYEGVEGMKQVYEDTLTATEPIVAYATYEDMHKALPGYFPAYYRRRAEKGIFARGIVPETPLARERVRENKNEARELALVPADKYTFSPDIEIYDNKVVIASWREKLGIIIESGEIADAMKKIFELAWIAAKGMEKE